MSSREQSSPRPQNHGGSAWQEARTPSHRTGIGDKPGYTQTSGLGHLHRLAFLVVFVNVIALRRLEGSVQEHETVGRDLTSNRLKQRLRIPQMLGQHSGNNTLAFAVTASFVPVQCVLHSELDAARMSGNCQQSVGHSHCWWADIGTFNLNVRSLFRRQKAQHTMPG